MVIITEFRHLEVGNNYFMRQRGNIKPTQLICGFLHSPTLSYHVGESESPVLAKPERASPLMTGFSREFPFSLQGTGEPEG